jgi:hypothetical protein
MDDLFGSSSAPVSASAQNQFMNAQSGFSQFPPAQTQQPYGGAAANSFAMFNNGSMAMPVQMQMQHQPTPVPFQSSQFGSTSAMSSNGFGGDFNPRSAPPPTQPARQQSVPVISNANNFNANTNNNSYAPKPTFQTQSSFPALAAPSDDFNPRRTRINAQATASPAPAAPSPAPMTNTDLAALFG